MNVVNLTNIYIKLRYICSYDTYNIYKGAVCMHIISIINNYTYSTRIDDLEIRYTHQTRDIINEIIVVYCNWKE